MLRDICVPLPEETKKKYHKQNIKTEPKLLICFL